MHWISSKLDQTERGGGKKINNLHQVLGNLSKLMNSIPFNAISVFDGHITNLFYVNLSQIFPSNSRIHVAKFEWIAYLHMTHYIEHITCEQY